MSLGDCCCTSTITLSLCRPVPEQRRHSSDHAVVQLPAVRRRDQGVSGRGLGQDGALPLPVLDPAAFHPLCTAGPLSAHPGGHIWCGAPAGRLQGVRYAQTGMGEEVPGVLSHYLEENLIWYQVFEC